MASQSYAVNHSATVIDIEQKRADYMGNPQLDDGHTRIANELLEAIISFPFTGRQLKIVLAIIRKTYGFNKKSDRLAQSVLADMTSIAKPHICKTLKELVAMKVVTVNTEKFAHVITFNKRYKEWESSYQIGNSYQIGSYQISNEIVTESVTKPLPNREPQKKERNKERNTQEIPAGFVEFWDAYGKKVGKPNSIKEWNKINPDQELIDLILTAAKKLCADRPEAKYRKDPERWLKGRMWEDYAEETYTSWADDPIFAGGI